MDSTIWAAVLTVSVMVLMAVFGWSYRLHEKIAELRNEQAKLREEHLRFQLEATQKYASIPYLQDVEERIVASIDKLSNVVDELRRSLVAISSNQNRHPSA